MTNNWDFYQLRVDDNPASMFVDLGIHKFAPKHDFPFSAMHKRQLKSGIRIKNNGEIARYSGVPHFTTPSLIKLFEVR